MGKNFALRVSIGFVRGCWHIAVVSLDMIKYVPVNAVIHIISVIDSIVFCSFQWLLFRNYHFIKDPCIEFRENRRRWFGKLEIKVFVAVVAVISNKQHRVFAHKNWRLDHVGKSVFDLRYDAIVTP